jgi:hypothetical protein
VYERFHVLENDKGRNLTITSVTKPEGWALSETLTARNGKFIIYR